MIDYESKQNNTVIFENFMGPSLKNILNFIEEEFDIITVVNLAIKIINVLKSIHSKYIIRNDIKPNNICLGKFINGNLQPKIYSF